MQMTPNPIDEDILAGRHQVAGDQGNDVSRIGVELHLGQAKSGRRVVQRSPRSFLIAAAIALLCAGLAWKFVRDAWTSIQIAFADEQTEIFSQMVVMANDALNRQPPDVKDAVGFLQYTVHYYPSGSKQTIGSALDRIVERSRSLAESRIIEMLRDATGVDHGPDAEDWIRELRKSESAGEGD